MHEMTPERVRGMILYYQAVKLLANRTEVELLRILIDSENFNKPADAIRVLGIVRKAAADLRGLKAP